MEEKTVVEKAEKKEAAEKKDKEGKHIYSTHYAFAEPVLLPLS